MAGTAAAVYSPDALTSPAAGSAPWDFAVPVGSEVSDDSDSAPAALCFLSAL